jgi:hypothetical protein
MSVFLRERDEPKELVGLIAPQRMLVALTMFAHRWSPL